MLAQNFNFKNGFIQRLKFSNPENKHKIWTIKYFILIMVRYNHLHPE